MKRYIVTNTILSRAPGATPADVTYYRGESKVQALAALVSGATLTDEMDDNALPEDMRYDVISTRLDVFRIEEERKQVPDTCSYCGTALVGEDCPNYGNGPEHADPSIKPLSFDNETNDYALSDCVWWDEPVAKRPWWARRDCSGRVGDTARGVLCEHHYNEGSKA